MVSPLRLLSPKILLSPRLLNSPLHECQKNLLNFKPDLLNVPKSPVAILNTPNKSKLLSNGVVNNLFQVLGKGTYGTVIKCKYKDENVAVKVVKWKETNLNENNGLSLNHKNVVKTLEILTSDNFGLVFMEYVPNSKNLQSVLDCSFLDDATTIRYAREIAKGLAFCHERGILHLDIKPKNVLVCDGVCKICDFGNSVRIGEIGHVPKGTVAYTAPEILKGLNPSCKSDVYSLGILFWQLRSRRNPYDFLSCNEVIIYKVVKFKIRPNYQDAKEADEFSKLYCECWQTIPNNRPELSGIIEILEEMSCF